MSEEIRAKSGDVSGGDSRRVVASWISWALVAALALLAARLWQRALAREGEMTALQTDARIAELLRRDARNHLEAERIVLNRQLAATESALIASRQELATATARAQDLERSTAASGRSEPDSSALQIFTLTSIDTPHDGLAIVIWNAAKQEGILAVENLRPAGRDQQYQLWIFDREPAPAVSGGVFTIDQEGRGRFPIRPTRSVNATKFSISRERTRDAKAPAELADKVILMSR